MCSSEDSFEGVAATFKWLEYKDWERLDLFDTHEHDGLIAQTMRRKANLVFRCLVLIVLSHCKTMVILQSRRSHHEVKNDPFTILVYPKSAPFTHDNSSLPITVRS